MKNDYSSFDSDLNNHSFHIYNKDKAKIKGFYPSKIPDDFHNLTISDINIDDIVTIRAYFLILKKPIYKIDSGKIDLQVECIDNNTIFGNILTELPSNFPLAKGTTIELDINEILYKQKSLIQ